MAKEIERLVQWYRDQCDGDWEHQHGIKLVTLDNPGWSLDVSLAGTLSTGKVVEQKRIERGDDDWIFYEVKEDLFRGRCGPGNLNEIVALFLQVVGR